MFCLLPKTIHGIFLSMNFGFINPRTLNIKRISYNDVYIYFGSLWSKIWLNLSYLNCLHSMAREHNDIIYVEDYCLNLISVIRSGALNSYKSYMVGKLFGRMSIFSLWILSQKLTTILEQIFHLYSNERTLIIGIFASEDISLCSTHFTKT
jgi:hypothetical protein